MKQSELVKDVLQSKIARRKFLLGGVTAAASVGFLGKVGTGEAQAGDERQKQARINGNFEQSAVGSSLLGFAGIAAITNQDFDGLAVPEGYSAEVLFSWGDKVDPRAVEWLSDGTNTAQEQELQAGQNHDGMHFFPINGASDHGLLVVNHEYVNPQFLHQDGPTVEDGKKPASQIAKEQAAHGVSVLEIRKDKSGQWSIEENSKYNRRIHGNTPMDLTGPVACIDEVKSKLDPVGQRVLGTYNNCAMGYTPWGTYLACEENFQNYFANTDEADLEVTRSQSRYGIKTESRYLWESNDPRFDITKKGESALDDYRNEANKYGWVVEIDPFKPYSTPKKRTAMGRLVRECATLSMNTDGTMAFYMGDDSRGEYLYKFVPNEAYAPGKDMENALDDGTLYVAAFYEDGSGDWLPLIFGKNGLTPLNGFKSQSDILINARAAADHLGATPMDRPEWVAVHPVTGAVYVTLTNNKNRGNGDLKQEVNEANPRINNIHGHIVKLDENNGACKAMTFDWDIFLLAGDPASDVLAHQGDIKGDIFSSPDGLYFDQSGRLWIQTDYSDSDPANKNFGLNQMLAADPATREVRRFFVGPKGCEVTGITMTPDQKTMFINVQHPTRSFPAGDGVTRPRSSTVIITKDDGGVVGT
ncbi:MAG: PhoX family phosphatase [Pseudobacteriovorax sp.]|nr:PhoX family phosphatase [Pseudobacteriovorax sp.]